MSATYQLMSRQGCHLCQQAAQRLAQLQVRFEVVDIDGDPALREQYHTLVPVLYCTRCHKELLFPFSEADIMRWAAHSHNRNVT